ncbi:S-layer homology domain-containing protein [Paenibacillus sp. MMS20-IR301]|uniref:S-layer homology domain-containing protein n=1 Tax=Paenibacillus sp. MMS20-IR301 TaxID=2895946 RepID=UPI0028E73295|nr:S-layer homology domain-containing protein [Paenibacillus sp. MMS20-IR301]WNS41201.1 S-layer homology domain-containing protein [Paenibacillus sp. MMS20-IR301]
MALGQAFAATGASSTSGTAAAAKDASGHWAENVLAEWQQKGLLTGYQDGSLKPDQQITRAEFTALVNKSFGYTQTAAISYKDVTPSNWFYTDIAKAAAAGYINGYPDQMFRPNQPLTREEMAVIASTILKLNAADPAASFTDTTSGHEWSKQQINAVAQAGLMNGYARQFRPLDTATRAEAISVLDRSLKLRTAPSANAAVYDKAGNYGPETGVATVGGSVYIEASGVVLRNTIITGDLVISEAVGKGDVTLKNVTVKGTTTIAGGGKNSIHVVDSVLVTVIVNKKDGSIRIVTEGSSSVEQITLQSGALLEEGSGTGSGFGNVDLSSAIPANAEVALAGTFETVDVFAAAIKVNLTSGSIGQLMVAPGAANAGIDIAGGASINNLILNAVAAVTGKGSIANALINASGSTIAQTPGHVSYGNNASAVIGTPLPGASTGAGAGGNDSEPVTAVVYGFEGYILDVDNQPVADMTIHFRKGLAATTGTIAASVVTDADGKYYANLAPGIYTGELSKEGYITTHVVGVSLTTHKNTGQNATAIKIPAADEIRIVLTWGEHPLDEDSHLVGPAPGEQSFHTWFGEKEYFYKDVKYADLDHDDTNSYGPETTTIRKRVDGKYTFYIHNYSGNGPEQTETLAASGAKVEIYNGNNAVPVKTYHIPVADSKQLYWYVFDMNVEGSKLSFVDKNMLTDSSPDGEVGVSPTVNSYTLSVENHAGANDVVTVNALTPGDVVSVYSNEDRSGGLLGRATVANGSTSVKITGLDFPNSSAIYVSLKKPNREESHAVPVTILTEASYAELATTIAGAFKDRILPGTMTVGQTVYLADPAFVWPRDLKVTVMNPQNPATVTEDVYILRDYYVWYMNYNGTAEPVEYSIKLQLKRDFSAVNKEIIITVPSVFTALPESIAYARSLNDPRLLGDINAAEAVVNDPESASEQYLQALIVLHEWFNLIARENS